MYFNCDMCYTLRDSSEVIILDCKHCFCFYCFERYLLSKMAKDIKCPSVECDCLIDKRHLKEILSDEDMLAYEVLCIEGQSDVHCCVLPECRNVRQFPDTVTDYICSKCTLWNCIPCDASHNGIPCAVYKEYSSSRRADKSSDALTNARQFLFKKIRDSLDAMSKLDLFLNDRVFQCNFCLNCIGKAKGIRLRSCSHNVCRPCLIKYVKESQSIPVKCPDGKCDFSIEDRELNCILNVEEFNIYQRKSVNRSKSQLINVVHCQQPNCDFMCELWDPKVKKFKCLKCASMNCRKCNTVHHGESCKQYQKKINKQDSNIEELIKVGQCMRCPGCKNLITKNKGCNWIRCCQCGLELCWMLKMRRWGPKGRGDISGGCKCGVNGYCHPQCIGCMPDL